MTDAFFHPFRLPCPLIVICSVAVGLAPSHADLSEIEKARTLRASFDTSTRADQAEGDAQLYTRVEEEAKAGLHTEEATTHVPQGGLSGGALKFTKRAAPWIFYKAADNVPYQERDWSGSVSCWLKLDPEEDLDPGYCDPIQLTTRAWNDAAFFVDFDKEGDPRDFRLGAFPDIEVWNPEKKEVPEAQRPLAVVENPPFGRDRWTHVAFTWEKFNTGEKDGVARFYLDGQLQGSITGWEQTFTWKKEEESRLYLGLNYIGLLDELSCYNRALTGKEIATLYQAQKPE